MKNFHLFEVFGIELEYMIVHQDDFKIAPLADRIFFRRNGSWEGEVNNGVISWSNELVSHVVELKTSQPAAAPMELNRDFQDNIHEINQLLSLDSCLLMPTACHPLMDPIEETQIWPHDQHEIYDLYNRIFDCRGHGWSNVQSTHLNLPFCGDQEFDRLHTAIRLLLPVLPALCSSSPILEGCVTGYCDSRMQNYQFNQREIPIITGKVIPEYLRSREEYQTRIFDPINAALRPYDKNQILDQHFVNSRGAIARFDRGAIEIRVMDIQECPAADLGIATFVIEVLKAMVYEEWVGYPVQAHWHENDLYLILADAIEHAENGVIKNAQYLKSFDLQASAPVTFRQFWKAIYDRMRERLPQESQVVIEHILEKGSLATRILKSLGNNFTPGHLVAEYKSLADCLANGELYHP